MNNERLNILQYLEKCDSVVFLQNGRVVEAGTHAELMEKENSEYANMFSYDQVIQKAFLKS